MTGNTFDTFDYAVQGTNVPEDIVVGQNIMRNITVAYLTGAGVLGVLPAPMSYFYMTVAPMKTMSIVQCTDCIANCSAGGGSGALCIKVGSAWTGASAGGTTGDLSWTTVNASGGASPALQGTCAAAFTTVRFYKDGQNVVHVDGAVNGCAIPAGTATLVFTLPTGYRPSQVVYLKPVSASAVTSPWAVDQAAIQVLTDGKVQFTYLASNTGLISLAASFPTK